MNSPIIENIYTIIEEENLFDGEQIYSIEKLQGGLINYIYRIRLQSHLKSLILKYYPPFIASIPEVSLSPSRCLFERKALQRLPSFLTNSRTPHFIQGAQSLNIIEDKGLLPSLSTVHSPLLIQEIAIWLAQIHETTKSLSQKERDLWNNKDIQRSRKQNQYDHLADNIKNLHTQKALRRLGQKLLQQGICVVMGDLWPSSILVDNVDFWVIDWEFSHFGRPLQDVSHICAHFVLMKQPHYCRLFLENYLLHVSEQLREDAMSVDATVHFCAEILMRTMGLFQDQTHLQLQEWTLDILRQRICFYDLIFEKMLP